MGAGNHVMRAAALVVAALVVASSPLVAQEPPPRPVKDVRERALDKLRALDRASRPVPDSAAADSVAADSVAADTASKAVVADRAPDAAGAAAAPLIVHMSPDSFATALRSLEGYALTEYRASDRARFVADSGRLELIGTPTLSREGQGLRADSVLIYNEQQSLLCGYGKPVIEGTSGEPVESERVCYDVDRRVGVALGARTKFAEGATWFVHGEELYTVGDNRIYGAGTNFTSCDLETPHYHFAAKSVKIVHDEILVARDVTLTFQDVPVFWLPFLVQSMKRGRRSGLLMPDFELTDVVRNQSGYDRRISNIGFYWAINDYMGAKVALDWWSDHWTGLNGAFQYNWQRQFLRGGADLTRFWRVDGSNQLSLRTDHSWRPGERTSVSISANFQAAEFVEQFSFDPRQLDRSIQSNASFNHRFDWGMLNVSANRTQYLTEERTLMTLPTASLSITPVTLFPAAGAARWYNNATWNASTGFTARSTAVDERLPGATNRDQEERQGSITSSFRMGNLSLSQSATIVENVSGAKPMIPDTAELVGVADTALSRELERAMNWNTSLGYTQRLVGNSTLNPSLSFGGRVIDTEESEPVAGPARLTFGASLNTKVYGFWPGFGPFSRLRHLVDPSLRYTYSPVPELTDVQRDVFGEVAGREVSQLSLTISQTWEAKYETSDTASAAAADTSAASLSGEPRRLPQARKLKLLSLSTSALAYDFVEARDGEHGFTTTQLSHSISSDLLGGLSLRLGHDLFRFDEVGEGLPQRRTFDPHIRSIQTGFDLDSNSWLFRVLGFGRTFTDEDTASTAAADSLGAGQGAAGPGAVGPGDDPFMGPGRIGRSAGRTGPVGTWRARLDYSLSRPPAGQENGRENQLVRGSISFQPTESWSVNWRTSYSFSEGEFSDHILTLSRDIHRWQANFDFVKSRNGNFMFRFGVHLLDNEYIKADYNERYEGPGTQLR